MIIDWVQDVGHIPVRQMLLQNAVRVVIIVSPSACTISAGMLSIPADFSCFSALTATSTSSRWMDCGSSPGVAC